MAQAKFSLVFLTICIILAWFTSILSINSLKKSISAHLEVHSHEKERFHHSFLKLFFFCIQRAFWWMSIKRWFTERAHASIKSVALLPPYSSCSISPVGHHRSWFEKGHALLFLDLSSSSSRAKTGSSRLTFGQGWPVPKSILLQQVKSTAVVGIVMHQYSNCGLFVLQAFLASLFSIFPSIPFGTISPSSIKRSLYWS